jgi:transposase, IS5 family
MIQTGLFDLEFRCRELEKNGDLLVKINEAVCWEAFRLILNQVREKERKSSAGRKAFDVILMFKILILQSLYNLADDAMEYQIRDRISFMRFLGLNVSEGVPDAKTIWLFREELGKLKLAKKLFDQFARVLDEKGLKAKKGQIIDASIVNVPIQRNSREQNKKLKENKTPEEWNKNVERQKDPDAKWVVKNYRRYYGYKNHISVDVKNKLIRSYEVTNAAVHDSNIFQALLDPANSSKDVYADSAYRSRKNSQILIDNGLRNNILRKGCRDKKMTRWERQGNRTRSRIRARVEHAFGIQLKMAGNLISRAIGQFRNATKIGLRNLAYNISRLPKLMNAA